MLPTRISGGWAVSVELFFVSPLVEMSDQCRYSFPPVSTQRKRKLRVPILPLDRNASRCFYCPHFVFFSLQALCVGLRVDQERKKCLKPARRPERFQLPEFVTPPRVVFISRFDSPSVVDQCCANGGMICRDVRFHRPDTRIRSSSCGMHRPNGQIPLRRASFDGSRRWWNTATTRNSSPRTR